MTQPPPEIPVYVPLPESTEGYRQPVWPKAVGIISICMGSLQVLVGMTGLAGALLKPMMMETMQAMGGPPAQTTSAPASGPNAVMMDPPAEVRRLQIGTPAVSLAAGGVLIFAGIWLLRRKRSARALHLIHVVTKAAATAMSVAGAWMLMLAMEASLANDAPEFAVVFQASMGAGIAFDLLLSVPYPTFLLIWFLRPSIARQVRQWP